MKMSNQRKITNLKEIKKNRNFLEFTKMCRYPKVPPSFEHETNLDEINSNYFCISK